MQAFVVIFAKILLYKCLTDFWMRLLHALQISDCFSVILILTIVKDFCTSKHLPVQIAQQKH